MAERSRASSSAASRAAVGERVVGLDACAVPSRDDRKVAAVQQRLLPLEEAQQLADQFRLLGDPNRVRILFALLEGGELCVCDLAASVEMAESTVSHALRLLRASGVVRNRRDGRTVYYRLADAHVRMLLDLSAEHQRHSADT